MIDSPWKLLVTLAVSAVVFGLPGYFIGRAKGRPVAGFFAGLLLTILGLVIIAVVPADREALIKREQDKLRIRQEAQVRMDGGARE